MNSEQARKIAETCALIKANTEADVRHFEGAAFTGANMSVWLGQLSAAVSACAGMIAALNEQINGA